MATFVIRELQNSHSYRDGETIQAENLSAAKRIASRRKCFHGTVLVIENESRIVLARKRDGERWQDVTQDDIDSAVNLY